MAKVTINKQGIARMMREMQREFDKHPIQVTTVADAPTGLRGVEGTTGPTTITYNGPVIHGGAAGAQLAWNNTGTVNQQQTRNEQITPGFEALAQAVVSTRQGLSAVGLSEQDLQDAEAAADEVLTEVTQETPDPSRLRRGVAALKGLLAPIATGLATGAGEGAQAWAQTAIEQLGNAAIG